MSQVPIHEAIHRAVQHHQQGRFAEAEVLYRQVLAVEPHQPTALHLLGVIAGQVGKPDIAVDLIRRAIAVAPNHAVFYSNLCKFCFDLQEFEEAIAAAKRAVELQPDYVDAIHNLAIVLNAAGRLAEAETACRRALAFKPDRADLQQRLGILLKDQARFAEAEVAFRQAIALDGRNPESYSGLGSALCSMGRLDEAIAVCQEAVRLGPDVFDSYNNLGIALQEKGRTLEAITAYKNAIRLKPEYIPPYNNLGNALNSLWRLEEAEAAYAEALRRQPKFAEAHCNRGNVLKDLWRIEEAVASYRRALELRSELPVANSNLLMTLNYVAGLDQADLCREARAWAERLADPLLKSVRPHENGRNPDRRLRIGFVSADFREHPSSVFFEPLLAARDREKLEVFCYSQVPWTDVVTERLRGLSEHWRSCVGLSDDALAQIVRQDQIDILIDLNLHSSGNRLLAFARKPAPIQLTWLAYPGTTGMRAMDYRLTDPYLDPRIIPDADYSEQSLRLPETFWCYGQPDNAPDVSELPAMSKGYITFGCLNNFCKVTQGTLETWSEILRSVPNSRLILHAYEGSHRVRVLSTLEKLGIDPLRIEFVGRIDKTPYFQVYQRIDIGLDPFPCAGGTTTCDALYMGVPVITLAGKTAISRCGASLLSNVGLPDLVTQSPSTYAQKAIALANDTAQLAHSRATLRQQMRDSPLMDAPRFTRAFERILRDIWRKWCDDSKMNHLTLNY